MDRNVVTKIKSFANNFANLFLFIILGSKRSPIKKLVELKIQINFLQKKQIVRDLFFKVILKFKKLKKK